MTSMAWYPLPQSSSSTFSGGDEFFGNQSADWSLWSINSSDDQNTAGMYSEQQQEGGAGQCSTAPSEEQSKGPEPLELEFAQRTEEMFMDQFSDEEMRRMDAPFEALDMFPGSMQSLLSYENMLSGVLTGGEEDHDAVEVDRNGVDTMDTCGFPLFSHDVQNGPEMLADPTSKGKATKRSRLNADTESAPGFEALVLEELEDVVFQLAKKTRICFRDAFYRLAENSTVKRVPATEPSQAASIRQTSQQSEGNASRVSTPGLPERETNAIDRTVADLTLKQTCSATQLHGSCCVADESGGRGTVNDQLDHEGVEGNWLL